MDFQKPEVAAISPSQKGNLEAERIDAPDSERRSI
jgi:hypothetical protein